jgi:AcrR family transcriptional regulator
MRRTHASHRSRTTPEGRAERRTQLLEAAIACIRRVGADASMEQIAAEAKVTKPVLYRYFRDKGDLYQAVARFRWGWGRSSPLRHADTLAA